MKFNPAFNVTMAAGQVGRFSLSGLLKPSVSAPDLKSILDYFVQEGAKSVEIFLDNCVGGSVFEGATMSSHIRACPIPVDAKQAGACASMATIIFGSCRKRLMDEMGYLVTHRPSAPDEGCYESHQSTSGNLKVVNDEVAKVYAALTGLSIEDAAAKFLPFAKDVFLSATEAVQLKLATGTWNSGVKAALPLDVLMKSDLKAVAAFYDKQLNKTQKSDMDLDKIAMAIGMAGEADEKKILQAVSQMKQDNVELKGKISTLETAATAEKEKSAKDYVKAALDAGKITAAEQAPFEKMAINDLDSVKAILDVRKPHTTASSQIKDNVEVDMAFGRKSGESDGKFYMRLWKEDPKTLEKIQKEKPELHKQLKEAGSKEV